MYRLGLIGAGISKSRMDRLQMYLGELSGLSVDYIKIDSAGVEDFDPVEQVQKCFDEGFQGVNITHPFKEKIWRVASPALEERYQPIGSFNTIKFSDTRMQGANTDYTGFIRGYQRQMENSAPGEVLMAGAGGVGKAIAFALGELGATTIRIFDQNYTQSKDLARMLHNRGITSFAIGQEDFVDAMRVSDGLINCTPQGMYNFPGSAFSADGIGGQTWAFDAVYTPLETEFLKACSKSIRVQITGFDLWIFQGLDAFRIFTGVEIESSETLFKEVLRWLER